MVSHPVAAALESQSSPVEDDPSSQRQWMRSELWSPRVQWDDYPNLIATAQDYATDPHFNPEGKKLTAIDRARLDEELSVWSNAIQEEKHNELLGAIEFLRRSWDRDDILFLPGSDELHQYQASVKPGSVKFIRATAGGMKSHPMVDESSTVVLAVRPGECPEVETAKRNLWAVSASAHDAVQRFFANL